MRLRFADGDEGINAALLPNESITKKFTLENTGTLDAIVSIEWLDMINTYTEGSLTYTLEYSESQDGDYTEIVNKTNVPISSTEFTSTLVPDLTIPVGSTYYYNLEITFNDLDGVDQTSDYDAKFVTRFVVSQPSTNRKYTLIIDPNGGKIDGSSEIQTYSLNANDTQNILTPIKDGLKFVGWIVSGYESNLNDGTLTLGKSNTKIVAKYKKSIASEIATKLNVTVNEGSPTFANPATTNEGVFAMEDDYGVSYYYRGAVENNYVKFGKWAGGTTKAGKDMYWRIIRINGDGSLRIRYDGTEAYLNGTNSADRFSHINQVFNAASNDNKYVGWMYGPAGTARSTSEEQAQSNVESSAIKTVVDEWYKTNIADQGYGKYVSDTIFCNDRSTPGSAATGLYDDTGLGYGTKQVAYGATSRIGGPWKTDKTQPSIICFQKKDAFTVNDEENGNGDLTYPVGLITADEVVIAGSGKYKSVNQSYYLYNPNTISWSITPDHFASSGIGAVFYVNTSGNNGNQLGLNTKGSIAPVINLTPEYVKTMVGTGTITDPYRDSSEGV